MKTSFLKINCPQAIVLHTIPIFAIAKLPLLKDFVEIENGRHSDIFCVMGKHIFFGKWKANLSIGGQIHVQKNLW